MISLITFAAIKIKLHPLKFFSLSPHNPHWTCSLTKFLLHLSMYVKSSHQLKKNRKTAQHAFILNARMCKNCPIKVQPIYDKWHFLINKGYHMLSTKTRVLLLVSFICQGMRYSLYFFFFFLSFCFFVIPLLTHSFFHSLPLKTNNKIPLSLGKIWATKAKKH